METDFNNNRLHHNMPPENKFSNIKTMSVNKIINNELILEGNFEIIGMCQNIGNFSGIIEINCNNLPPYEYIVWDQWCHYTRQNVKINTQLSNKLIITVLQKTVDTSACKTDIDFNSIIKYLDIIEIYYIGDLQISYIC